MNLCKFYSQSNTSKKFVYMITLAVLLIFVACIYLYNISSYRVMTKIEKEYSHNNYNKMLEIMDDQIKNKNEQDVIILFKTHILPYLAQKGNTEIYSKIESHINKLDDNAKLLWIHTLTMGGYIFKDPDWIITKYLAPDSVGVIFEQRIKEEILHNFRKEDLAHYAKSRILNYCEAEKYNNYVNKFTMMLKSNSNNSIDIDICNKTESVVMKYNNADREFNLLLEKNKQINDQISDISTSIKNIKDKIENNNAENNPNEISLEGKILNIDVMKLEYGFYSIDIKLFALGGIINLTTMDKNLAEKMEGDIVRLHVNRVGLPDGQGGIVRTCHYDNSRDLSKQLDQYNEEENSLRNELQSVSNQVSSMETEIAKHGGINQYKLDIIKNDLVAIKTILQSQLVSH